MEVYPLPTTTTATAFWKLGLSFGGAWRTQDILEQRPPPTCSVLHSAEREVRLMRAGADRVTELGRVS